MKTKIPHIILAGLFGASTANSATIVMDDASSSRITSNTQSGSGTNLAGSGTNYVGTKSNGAGIDGHAGFAFQMTGASASDLLSANFSVSYTGVQTAAPNYNVDVYVNRVSLSAAFEVADFQNGTKLMDDFVITSDSTGNYSLDTDGQTDLFNYLSTNWVEDSYLIITLKANTDPGFIMGEDANANYQFGSFGATDAQLTVTAVPEPSSAALLGLGGLALMLRRRK